MISSLVFQEDIDDANYELDEFISYYTSVGDNYVSHWTYDGTRHFIKKQSMDESRKKLLLKLIQILETPKKDITIEMFKE